MREPPGRSNKNDQKLVHDVYNLVYLGHKNFYIVARQYNLHLTIFFFLVTSWWEGIGLGCQSKLLYVCLFLGLLSKNFKMQVY